MCRCQPSTARVWLVVRSTPCSSTDLGLEARLMNPICDVEMAGSSQPQKQCSQISKNKRCAIPLENQFLKQNAKCLKCKPKNEWIAGSDRWDFMDPVDTATHRRPCYSTAGLSAPHSRYPYDSQIADLFMLCRGSGLAEIGRLGMLFPSSRIMKRKRWSMVTF